MEAEVKEAIVLLKNLEYQLKHETYGDLNKFTDFAELYQVIDETIFDLQNTKYEGITLSVRVGKTMSYINDALAFRGLRLSKKQSEAWNLFVHPTDKKLQKNEIIFKLINEFGVWREMQYQEYISLLEAFRLSLTAENDPNIVQIVEQINKTVANLKTGKYYAVALTSQLFDVVSLVENLMAFNDLKLNTFQSKVWNKLRDATYQRYTKDGNLLNFIPFP